MVDGRGKVLALLPKFFLNHFEDGGLVLLIESVSCQKQLYKLAQLDIFGNGNDVLVMADIDIDFQFYLFSLQHIIMAN